MEDRADDQNSEFHVRFNASRLLARRGESIRFDGEEKTARIGGCCLLSVNLDDGEIVLSYTSAECKDIELRDSLAATPCDQCLFAEISVFARGSRLMPVATIPIGEVPLGRVEIQQVRAALEATAGRLQAAIEQTSQG